MSQPVRKPHTQKFATKPTVELLQNFEATPEYARFDQRTIAAVRGCSTALLERDRWEGKGIPFVRDGRNVRYTKRDVLEFLNKQRIRRSTSDSER